MLTAATLAEFLAYYIPAVENLLDILATPAALVAGTIVSAAVMTDVPPMVKWTAAGFAGGGVAGLTQGVTALLRAKSTVLTGGVGNVIPPHGRAPSYAVSIMEFREGGGSRNAIFRGSV